MLCIMCVLSCVYAAPTCWCCVYDCWCVCVCVCVCDCIRLLVHAATYVRVYLLLFDTPFSSNSRTHQYTRPLSYLTTSYAEELANERARSWAHRFCGETMAYKNGEKDKCVSLRRVRLLLAHKSVVCTALTHCWRLQSPTPLPVLRGRTCVGCVLLTTLV